MQQRTCKYYKGEISETISKLYFNRNANSQHAKGQAADIEIPGVDNLKLAQYIQDKMDFDQLILECYTGDPSSGWVHVSYNNNGENRKDVLTYDRTNGYRKGLIT